MLFDNTWVAVAIISVTIFLIPADIAITLAIAEEYGFEWYVTMLVMAGMWLVQFVVFSLLVYNGAKICRERYIRAINNKEYEMSETIEEDITNV